ncbi:putative Vacuole membrane protein [Zostera marina]|uniref:Putative Vacuole membrane protein n=1 Tax=Zostera marina TaxID=29655 RepID=A0A0K9PT59_ZOSMR|nr:putative Vacuole membrane protein [Zostera marina]
METFKFEEVCSSSLDSTKAYDDDDDGSECRLSELRKRHRLDRENLTLMSQPFHTMFLFNLAAFLYMKQSFSYVMRINHWLVAISILAVSFGFFLLVLDGPHEKHVQVFLEYFKFGLWWIVLGIASSIGLGSGLHTFVMYLGPHIAFFTLKAMQCGRVDLKASPYDTIRWSIRPSWLEKDCSDFGPPLFSSLPDTLVRVPFSSILSQIQLEAVLWGVGTAIGELPPYFISKAARKSENKKDIIEEFDDSSSDKKFITVFLKRTKHWLLSHSQHLNFFTILLLASVPNPLFDLAGIMCGQFGIPFWKFFLSTLIGKAIIKTHMQSVFIIILCNNQLLEWVENELIWVLGHIPVFATMLQKLIPKLKMVQEKILSPSSSDPSSARSKHWTLSFNLIWNTLVWLMILNFLVRIVTSTAQEQLKKQQEIELKKRSLLLNSTESNYKSIGQFH